MRNILPTSVVGDDDNDNNHNDGNDDNNDYDDDNDDDVDDIDGNGVCDEVGWKQSVSKEGLTIYLLALLIFSTILR